MDRGTNRDRIFLLLRLKTSDWHASDLPAFVPCSISKRQSDEVWKNWVEWFWSRLNQTTRFRECGLCLPAFLKLLKTGLVWSNVYNSTAALHRPLQKSSAWTGLVVDWTGPFIQTPLKQSTHLVFYIVPSCHWEALEIQGGMVTEE